MAELSSYCHPSFGLGNIARPEVVDVLDQIRAGEERVDAAHDRLDAAVQFKRGLTMTLNELADMGVDTASVAEKIGQIDGSISDAANEYVTAKLEHESTVCALKKTLCDFPATQMPESPVDMLQSKLCALPLGTESLRLDSQYFAFEGNLQEDKLASIEKFVRSATSNVAARSDELSRSVCDQISDQVENHRVCGTLIVTVSCTHRNVQLFSPLMLDPDKAVKAWNMLKADKIDISDPAHVRRASSENPDDGIPLITGAMYGSSFIGMAHLLQSETNTMGNIDELKKQLDKKLKAGGWLADVTGEMGVDRMMMDEVRAFLSANSISCHIGIVAMGAIPSIKSSELTTSYNRLADLSEDQIPSFDDDAESESASSAAESARQNALANTIRNARIGAILSEVSKSDDRKNRVLDMTTLVEALDNYVGLIGREGKIEGVPIRFFIRKFSKTEIANLWLKRYYPLSGDGE